MSELTEATRQRVRNKRPDAPFFVDTCHGMVGGPAILGPTGIIGYMQGEENQRNAAALCDRLNWAWSHGYVQGHDDGIARGQASVVEIGR